MVNVKLKLGKLSIEMIEATIIFHIAKKIRMPFTVLRPYSEGYNRRPLIRLSTAGVIEFFNLLFTWLISRTSYHAFIAI